MYPSSVRKITDQHLCFQAASAVLFVVLYLGGIELGHLLSFPEHFPTFWPPSGIFLAALLRTETRQWPTVFLLTLGCSYFSDVSLHGCSGALSLGFWTVNATEALTGAWLVRKLLRSPPNCDSLHDVLVVSLVAGVLNTMVGASLGALLITRVVAGETFTEVWHLWWVSDMLGVVIFTPLLLTLTAPGKIWSVEPTLYRKAEAVTAILGLVFMSELVYGPAQHPIAFLVVTILIWIALRFEMRMICVANLARSIIAIGNTKHGFGPFATDGTLSEQVLQVQVFLCLTSASFLVLAAVVSERHRATRILKDSEARYRDLVENIDDLVDSVNCDGRIVYANRAWRETLGYSPEEVSTLSIFQVIHPEDLPRYRRNFERLMQGGTLDQMELRFITRTGRTLIVEGNCNCRMIDGQPSATRSIFRDVTSRREHESQLKSYHRRLEEANRQLLRLATTDGLTGLQNRRAFEGRLTEEVERSQRYGTPVSLLLLDVDHFKQFNDSFGHLVGDEVLKRVSRILEAVARASDFVARYGGEEFAIILPNTDASGAFSLAERFREAIALEPFQDRGITASVGVATLNSGFPLSGDVVDGSSLVKAADEALYFSKLHGRNQVHLAEDLHYLLT
ncbi:MAG: diguanylate cyclase [Planctomycetota bacterium]